PPRVDRQHEHLPAEPFRDLADQLGAGEGGGVDADLVSARAQQLVDILRGPHAAAHGQRDEDLLRRAPHHVVRGLAVAGGGRDVEERQFVGAFGVVELGHLDGVAGVAQVLEVDSLDDAAVVHVEAGDDTYGEGHDGAAPGYASTSTSTS